jgi:hypothetical protein
MSLSRSRLVIVSLGLLTVQCGRDEATDQCTSLRFAAAIEGTSPHCAGTGMSTWEDGSSACRAFAASSRAQCDCDARGRTLALEGDCRLDLRASGDLAAYACVCELTQLAGAALSNCLSDNNDTTDGWCYADRAPACGVPASEEVTGVCDSGHRFKLQGGAALSDDETLLLVCNTLNCD